MYGHSTWTDSTHGQMVGQTFLRNTLPLLQRKLGNHLNTFVKKQGFTTFEMEGIEVRLTNLYILTTNFED